MYAAMKGHQNRHDQYDTGSIRHGPRMTSRGLQFTDLARLRLASDPQLSAGRKVAYVQSWLDLDTDVTRRTVVIAAADALAGSGGAADLGPADPGASATQLAPPLGETDAWSPRWSPDGDCLAMIAAGQVTTWRREAGQLVPLADVPGAAADLAWSPAGDALTVTCVRYETASGESALRPPDEAGYLDGAPGLVRVSHRIFVLPADGGQVRPLVEDGRLPRWSPDGKRLAFLRRSARDAGASLCVIDPQRPAEVTVLATGVVTFTWSPSGDELAYLAPAAGYTADIECRLFRCRAAGDQQPVELAGEWDRSIGSTVRGDDARGAGPQAPVWSPATGRIYFSVAVGGQGQIGWAGPDPADYGVLCDGPRSCIDISLDPGGEAIAYVSTSPADPGNVFVTDLRSGAEHQVSTLNAWLGDLDLAAVRLVRARAADGTPIEGWLTSMPERAPQAGLPLVVSIHGGPHYPAGYRFSGEAQRLAARGYAVLTANPRGSGGYGRAFAAAIRGSWGTQDWTDVTGVLDAAAAEGGLDDERIAVTGVSYGGYLTMRAITLTGRFRAAISENGISNLLALWGSGAEDPGWLTGEMGGTPWERAPEYVAASPLTAAARIRTPLLLIHAELDHNCPVSQSEQMLAALRQQGAIAELVRLPGEGHLVNLNGRPSRRLARARAVEAWLDRYLLDDRPEDDSDR
jgi:dipeptidyl aminopeptidase/acylaminoacyl peptidase